MKRYQRKWRIARLWNLSICGHSVNKNLEEHVDKYSGQEEKYEGKIFREQTTPTEKD